jgi:hypothetical protein
MPPLDIQRSKLVDTIVTSTRCNNTLNFMFFIIIVGNTSFTKAKREGNTTCRHYHKTNLRNQILSQVERAMYPLRMNIQTPNLYGIVTMPQFFIRICGI